MVRRFWRVHGRTLLVATGVLAGLVVLRGVTSDADQRRPELPTRAQVCRGFRQAADQLREQFGRKAPPRERLDALVKEACRRGATPVPAPTPQPAEPTPGCHTLEAAGRGPSLRPHLAALPKRRIPFFARRSGKLPPSGTPTVGGVRLPRGSRCARFWSTDARVEDAFGLAGRLAAVFSSTGLWPVIWAWQDEEPDAYVMGSGNLAHADSIDAARVLRRSWRVAGLVRKGPFPGIASGADDSRLTVQPFGDLVETSTRIYAPSGGFVVMLVPVNRPADVFSVLGTETTEWHSDDDATAVLRSWEERFGAVVAVLTPSTVDLAVGAPPRDGYDARRLAAEHAAFAPEDDTEGLDAVARQLRSTRRAPGVTSAHHWGFGWPD
jgi:Domain of unknown function (DUF4253)